MSTIDKTLINHLITVVRSAEECFLQSKPAVGRSLFYYVLEEVRNLFEPGHAMYDDKTGHSNLRSAERQRFTNVFDSPYSKQSKNAVMLVTDSLALPRESQQIADHDTWPYLLRREIKNAPLYVNSQRGRTIIGALDVIKEISWPVNKLVVQVGIVDCTPRIVFPTDMATIRAALGNAAYLTMLELSKNFRSHLGIQKYKKKYISEGAFNLTAREIVKQAESKGISAVYFVEIVFPEKMGKAIAGGQLFESISNYNSILEASVGHSGNELIKANDALWASDLKNRFANDGYHLGLDGHIVLATKLSGVLNKKRSFYNFIPKIFC